MFDAECPVQSAWWLLLPVCAGEGSWQAGTLRLPRADDAGRAFPASFPALGDAGGAARSSSLSPLSCLGFCAAGVAWNSTITGGDSQRGSASGGVGRRDPSHPGFSGLSAEAALVALPGFVKNVNISSEILASQCVPLY